MVELENGTILNGNDFIGPPQKGRVITILGDTRYCEASRELAQDADVLVHEATLRQKMNNKHMIIFIPHLSKLQVLHFRQMQND